MIQVEGLTKIFHDKKRGKVLAVDNLKFNCQKGQIFGLLGPNDCQKGQIFGLLGPNGAGKTTTLRILATMMLPTKGEIMVNGLDVVKHPAKVRRQIGFLSSETGLYDRFTPRETVMFFGRINGVEDKVIKKRTGMKQKLSIARSIIHDPPVLILDEPTVGLDIITAKIVIEYVKSFRDQGKCIIYSTHIMREAEKLCDMIAIIHQGNLIAQGTLEELKENSSSDDLEEIFFELINQGENLE